MASQRKLFWLEHAQLYENDQKETKNSIVETTGHKQKNTLVLGSKIPRIEEWRAAIPKITKRRKNERSRLKIFADGKQTKNWNPKNSKI